MKFFSLFTLLFSSLSFALDLRPFAGDYDLQAKDSTGECGKTLEITLDGSSNILEVVPVQASGEKLEAIKFSGLNEEFRDKKKHTVTVYDTFTYKDILELSVFHYKRVFPYGYIGQGSFHITHSVDNTHSPKTEIVRFRKSLGYKRDVFDCSYLKNL